jgi:hypothetical protein
MGTDDMGTVLTIHVLKMRALTILLLGIVIWSAFITNDVRDALSGVEGDGSWCHRLSKVRCRGLPFMYWSVVK